MDDQDYFEEKIEQQRNMITEEDDQYTANADQQRIMPLRRELNKLCSTKELKLNDLKRYETKMDLVSVILFVTVNPIVTSFLVLLLLLMLLFSSLT
jgi:hypothetical protein